MDYPATDEAIRRPHETIYHTYESTVVDSHLTAAIGHTSYGCCDLISFLSTIAASIQNQYTELALLSTYIGPWNISLPVPSHRGASCSVILLRSQDLLTRMQSDVFAQHRLPRVVALKTPILDKEFPSSRNDLLLGSMAKEYHILKDSLLNRHENIITLIGCCWQSPDFNTSCVVPSLVLEGTKLGDLESFNRTRKMTLRKKLGICIDIASGLSAIHGAKIVHGDIKLQNILIFQQKSHRYTAKIADFGTSLILSEVKMPTRSPRGTVLYSAPECSRGSGFFDQDGLFKTDLFSLGVVFLFLIKGIQVSDMMRTFPVSHLAHMKENGTFLAWAKEDFNYVDELTTVSTKDQENSEHDDGWETDVEWKCDPTLGDGRFQALFRMLMGRTLAPLPSVRFEQAEDVLVVLRSMLRQTLLLAFEKSSSTHNSAAQIGQENVWTRLAGLSPININSVAKMNGQEVDAFLLCSLLSPDIGNVRKDLQFINKHSMEEWQSGVTSAVAKLPMFSASYSSPEKCAKPRNFVLLTKGKMMINSSWNTGLIWLLPYPVREHLALQLRHFANNAHGTKECRSEAAFEYAVIALSSAGFNLEQERIIDALGFLNKAAEDGHYEARCIVGWLHDTFDYPNPFSADTETKWIFEASLKGSVTAKKRLQTLAPQRYKEATGLIRSRFAGGYVEIKLWPDEERELENLLINARWIPNTYVHYLAGLGRLESLRKLSELPKELFNIQNGLGETPLMEACRCGHTDVAILLLHLGSDPSIGTFQGVYPLHFLSAFDDRDIPKMTELLVEYGAELETCTINGKVFAQGLDGKYGAVEGSPLLWAVVAGNTTAVRALVDMGADAFDSGPESSCKLGSNGDQQPSPLEWAAMTHQYHIIEILISSLRNVPRQAVDKDRLNLSFRWVGETTSVNPILWAINCEPAIKLQRLLIHGRDHQYACLESVRILIRYGADPMRLTCNLYGQEEHPIRLACQGDNYLLLEYLWEYKTGLLRPQPKEWLGCIQVTILSRNRRFFDFLVVHRKDLALDNNVDLESLTLALKLCDDIQFFSPLLQMVLQRQSLGNRKLDLADYFEDTLQAGHFKMARYLFEKENFDLVRRISGQTLLGRLIFLSWTHTHVNEKLRFLLSLSSTHDELFWSIWYIDGSPFTALHAVVYDPNPEDEPLKMSARAFNTILEHFKGPKYLNARVWGNQSSHYSGYSALHVAIEKRNFEAAVVLMGTPGIDINLQNWHGESPTDICIEQYQELTRCMNTHALLVQDLSIQKKRQDTRRLMEGLIDAGGRIFKFTALIFRTGEDLFDYVDRSHGKISEIKLRESAKSALLQSSYEMIQRIDIGDVIPFTEKLSKYSDQIPVDIVALVEVVLRSRSSHK